MSEYEREKERNIARNKLLLEDLGLDKPFFEPKETRPGPTRKRKAPADKEPSDRSSPAKVSRVVSEEVSSERRRSQRNVGKNIDYKGIHKRPDPPPIVQTKIEDDRGPFGRQFGERTQDPCVWPLRS
jgi:E3 ubiquitin-protein ligase UHRF1